ncbi:MAG TPA: dihydrofolate reductase [Candidatus Saccharibacteria bacterium]|jgi:dihydrofolate reductase|nr:dihydrofolate reductase [Candidatus Saccharibacteria bacterium]
MISLIAAIGKNNEIGIKGQLPWSLPEDLKHFKNLTMGKTIIMGRKTFESIGRTLPGRTNVVITRNQSYKKEGILVADSVEQALKLSKESNNIGGQEVFIIGGGEIYSQTLSLADKLYITEVDFSDDKADAFFPKIDSRVWRKTSELKFKKDDRNQYDFSFVEYSRD